MAMTRSERRIMHKKQERLQILSEEPQPDDLLEGVPVIRSTAEGLVEYVKYLGELYKSVYTKVL